MKKYYEEPEMKIRNYSLSARDIVMTSDMGGDLEGGDEYPLNNDNDIFK